MEQKSTIPFWSIDAFLYFVMHRDFESKWSSELLSRTSTFIDAYILFDKVVLPERYKKNGAIKKLDPNNEIFEYVESSALLHSDDLTKGVSIDLSLNFSRFEELESENYKWFSQHRGYLTQGDYENLMQRSTVSFAHLRLWQISLLNEISDLTQSTSILPLSLQDIDTVQTRELPFHVAKLTELDDHYQETIKAVSATIGESYTDHIKNVPPFLSLLIDQALSREHSIEVLFQLRRDFKSLRQKGTEFSGLLKKATGLRERKDIIDEWSHSWELLHKGDFRKPQLLNRKVSSTDVSKAIVKPQSSGVSSIIQSFLDYREEVKSYNRFRIYGELYNELDGIEGAVEKLRNKFSLNLINVL